MTLSLNRRCHSSPGHRLPQLLLPFICSLHFFTLGVSLSLWRHLQLSIHNKHKRFPWPLRAEAPRLRDSTLTPGRSLVGDADSSSGVNKTEMSPCDPEFLIVRLLSCCYLAHLWVQEESPLGSVSVADCNQRHRFRLLYSPSVHLLFVLLSLSGLFIHLPGVIVSPDS